MNKIQEYIDLKKYDLSLENFCDISDALEKNGYSIVGNESLEEGEVISLSYDDLYDEYQAYITTKSNLEKTYPAHELKEVLADFIDLSNLKEQDGSGNSGSDTYDSKSIDMENSSMGLDNNSNKEQPETTIDCQFSKYGFEKPDFECEIFKEDYKNNQECYGVVSIYKDLYACSWNIDGTLQCVADNTTVTKDTDLSEYNLTPLKKKWYETPNKAKHVMLKDNDSNRWYLNIFYSEDVQEIGIDKFLHTENKEWRYATKKEVLSIYKD